MAIRPEQEVGEKEIPMLSASIDRCMYQEKYGIDGGGGDGKKGE